MSRFLIPAIDFGSFVIYLIRDNFNTAIAAGSIDTTSADTGPGTRTVIDTENKLSIGS